MKIHRTLSIIILLQIMTCCNRNPQKTNNISIGENDTLSGKISPKTDFINDKKTITDSNTLDVADLDLIVLLTRNQKSEYFEKGKPLNDYITIDLIDKPIYDSKKKTAVNFLLPDTLEQKKRNGTIALKCIDKTVEFIDKPHEEESLQEFRYVGQIEFLNQYLINGTYWEGLDYKFIDKKTGEETQSFEEYPHISPDKRHIVCINANPYDTTADMQLYRIIGSKLKHVMNASFKKWMPAIEQEDIFWSTDGYLYLAVNHVNAYWTKEGSLNKNYQYIRIKVI